MSMKIRFAQDTDYAAIARLHRSTIRHVNSKDYPAEVISIWSKRTKASRYRESAAKVKRWVAVEKGKIIGFCDHGFQCEIGGLYVHKDFQGKGVGRKLLKKMEVSMKQLGCNKIKIVSTISAKYFYKKHGYRVIKKKLHQIENKKVDVFLMNKNI
jgi:putative acetyltransferase